MNRIDILEKKLNTLYQRMYARHERRDRQKHAAETTLHAAYRNAVGRMKTVEKAGRILGAIQREIDKGRIFFTVTQQEYGCLRAWLKRKRKKRVFSL